MKKLETNDYQYNSLFPNSIISKNSLPYKKTCQKLHFFLSNNFSSNGSNNYKFQINSPKNKTHIKKQKTILKNSPNSNKSNIISLIDSLRRDLYISYNYYDNTKGCLQSAKHRNSSIKLMKRKSYNNFNKTNSINDSNINNANFLSFDSKSNNSNINLFKINSHKIRSKALISKNDSSNMNSFSFTKYILSHKGNKSINTSTPQTPISTRYRSKIKTNTLKLEYDSLFLNESVKKNNSKKRSSFSYEPQIRNENALKKGKKFNDTNIKKNKEQREFHQKLNLNILKDQVRKFEESNAFYVNDLQLQSNLRSPFKFQRNHFKKKIKKAEKENDFFFTRSPLNSANKYEHLLFKRKKNKRHSQSPHDNFCNEKSKKLIKKMQNLQKKAIFSKNILKNIDFKLRTKKLKKIIEFVVPIHHNVKEIDEQFKNETLNYQKNIGQFFIYKGNGLYSSHLSTLLKGDKMLKNNIKLEDDL